MRPKMGYYEGMLDEAATVLESLAMSHPFVDGNKRTAVGADAFLALNGHFIDCDSRAAMITVMRPFESNAFRFASCAHGSKIRFNRRRVLIDIR